MISTAQRNATEEAAIRRVIDSLDLPPGVKEYRLSLRDDNFGDPGVYILFLLDDSLSDDEAGEVMDELRFPVADAILQSPETERFPFPSFRRYSQHRTIEQGQGGVSQ
jgi:hypothetical protein